MEPLRHSVALHEAAHALVALKLGYRVVRVRLEPGAHPAGSVELAPRRLPDTRPVAEGRIMLLLSGVCAQACLAPSPRNSLPGAAEDLSRAASAAVELVGPARASALVAHLLSLTERLLRAHATQVLRIHQALLARGELSGEELVELAQPLK